MGSRLHSLFPKAGLGAPDITPGCDLAVTDGEWSGSCSSLVLDTLVEGDGSVRVSWRDTLVNSQEGDWGKVGLQPSPHLTHRQAQGDDGEKANTQLMSLP